MMLRCKLKSATQRESVCVCEEKTAPLKKKSVASANAETERFGSKNHATQYRNEKQQ